MNIIYYAYGNIPKIYVDVVLTYGHMYHPFHIIGTTLPIHIINVITRKTQRKLILLQIPNLLG